MSGIPYPYDVDRNLEEEWSERRYAIAIKMIDPGDVIAEVESMVSQIIRSEHHSLYGVVQYYLDTGGPDTGRQPWNLEALAAAYDRLVQGALSKLIDATLADVGAWED